MKNCGRKLMPYQAELVSALYVRTTRSDLRDPSTEIDVGPDGIDERLKR
jgi:hypothetical protein